MKKDAPAGIGSTLFTGEGSSICLCKDKKNFEKHSRAIMAILALITSGNNYVGLGSRRGGATPHRLDSNGGGGGGGVQWHSLHQQHSCKQHSRLKVTIVR